MTSTPATSGHASVNGLEMYYESHGEGSPIVLLHGNLSTIEVDFGALIPLLAATRRVIAVEFQAHGRTPDIDRPLRTEHWADDVVALLDHLGVEKADLYGYSSGSAVALHLGLTRPDLVGKLVLASTAYTLDGLHPGGSWTTSATSRPRCSRAHRSWSPTASSHATPAAGPTC